MTEYFQILKRAQEQGINFDGKSILIPTAYENRYSLNGNLCFGRVFEKEDLVVVLQEVDDPFSEEGFIKEPFIYRIIDKYKTYLSNDFLSYLVEFYTIE